MGHHMLKTVQNTCFSTTHGLGSFLRKVSFLPLLDPDDPLGTHLFQFELAACRSVPGLGTGM